MNAPDNIQEENWQNVLKLSREIALAHPSSKVAERTSEVNRKKHALKYGSDANTEIAELVKSAPDGSYAPDFRDGRPVIRPIDRVTQDLILPAPRSISLELSYRASDRKVLTGGENKGKEVLFLNTNEHYYQARVVPLVDSLNLSVPPQRLEGETDEDFYTGKGYMMAEEFTYSDNPEFELIHRISTDIPWYYSPESALSVDDVVRRLSSHLGAMSLSGASSEQLETSQLQAS
jgi:hypothetical protein